MNQRQLTVFAAAVLVIGWLAHPAGAQTRPADAISDEDKQATAVTEAIIGRIGSFVDSNIATLNGSNAVEQAKARQALINVAWLNPNQVASPQFSDAYCRKLGPALEALLAPAKPMRTRLNAAIILARVAEASANVRLTPAIKLALSDSSDGVALWGMKAAKAVIPSELQVQVAGQRPPILSAIAPAMVKHPMGEVAMEAFDVVGTVGRLNPLTSTQIKAVIPVAQELLNIRAKLYANGVPEMPGVELAGATFLATRAWKDQTAEDRVKSVQVLFDLLVRANQAKAGAAGNSDLKKVVDGSAGAILVIGGNLSDQAIVTAATAVVSASQQGQTPAQIAKLCDALLVAIKANKDLAGVQQPAAIAPPAAPATTTSRPAAP